MINFNIPTYDDFVNACDTGDIDSVNRALEIQLIRIRASDEGNRALREAAKNGHLAVVNRLLEINWVRVSAAVEDNHAFRLAAKNGHLPVVNRLLEIDGVKELAAIFNNEALISAVLQGNDNLVKRLLEVEKIRELAWLLNLPLKFAVEDGHHAIAVMLLKIPSVSKYLKTHQKAFMEEHKVFLNEVFKETEAVRVSKVLATMALSEVMNDYVVNHLLGLAYHDTLCGKSECVDLKKGNAEGLITCPIVNQFRHYAVGAKGRAQAKLGSPSTVSSSTNSTSKPAAKRPKAE